MITKEEIAAIRQVHSDLTSVQVRHAYTVRHYAFFNVMDELILKLLDEIERLQKIEARYEKLCLEVYGSRDDSFDEVIK